MTDTTLTAHSRPSLAPPPVRRQTIRETLFADLGSATLTIVLFGILLALLPPIVSWGVLDAVWSGAPEACRAGGACWIFIADKMRLILFGTYPPDEQWRPIVVIALIAVALAASLSPALWGGRLIAAWASLLLLMLVLMFGGAFGLTYVPTGQWGGLPVTLLLAVLSLGLGFPFAVLLALGRRSRLPILRWVSTGTIEIVRGLPLIGLLFVASILLPLLLPQGLTIDKLGRTLAALTVFSAAYLAEVLRGGFQGVPNGQGEAARALGIPAWKAVWHIVLPQAIQKVIPPLTNTGIVMVKNTSLVFIVGVFDMLSAGRAAATDPAWPAPYTETYLFVAAVYFVICYGISRYSLWLEARLHERERR